MGIVASDNHTNDALNARFDPNCDYPVLVSWPNRKCGPIGKSYTKPVFTTSDGSFVSYSANDGDTIEFILDFNAQTLKYRLTRNIRDSSTGENTHPVFECNVHDNIRIGHGISYKMAFQLPFKDDVIINQSLLEFK